MKHTFYFTNFNHLALDRDTLYYKSKDIEGERATIAKNVEYIIKKILEEYKSNSTYLNYALNKSLELKHNNKPYPIEIDDNLLKDIEIVKKDLEQKLNLNIDKIYFINLIIFTYFQMHKNEIIMRELEFWNQDYFLKGNQNDS